LVRRSFIVAPGQPSDDSSTPRRKLCLTSAAGTPQRESINLMLIMAASIWVLWVDPAPAVLLRSARCFALIWLLAEDESSRLQRKPWSTLMGFWDWDFEVENVFIIAATAGSKLSVRSPGL
jgi:hypothetical protein